MNDFFFYIFIILTSLFFTELIRRYSLKNNLLDAPNKRSSHHVATPRSGGLSIVLIFIIVIGMSDLLAKDIVFALVGSGVLIAIVGFWDDLGHVAAKWRLLFHFIAAFWVLFILGSVAEFELLGVNINVGIIGTISAAFLLVWLLNLFNFMDGIDGIAASEAIFVSCGSAFFFWLSGLENLSFIALILASSTMGFLVLNWPPAKIFMGDVGSGFLGITLGVIVYAAVLEGVSIFIWIVLLGVFFVDSGITLIRRVLNGERWYEAHCSHAYQHAARKWGHKKVTITTILINLCWLFPIAYLVYLNKSDAELLTLLAYIPLIILALKFQAGVAAISNNHSGN